MDLPSPIHWHLNPAKRNSDRKYCNKRLKYTLSYSVLVTGCQLTKGHNNCVSNVSLFLKKYTTEVKELLWIKDQSNLLYFSLSINLENHSHEVRDAVTDDCTHIRSSATNFLGP